MSNGDTILNSGVLSWKEVPSLLTYFALHCLCIVADLYFVAAVALEQMESTIASTLNNDTECISAVHCLKVSSTTF